MDGQAFAPATALGRRDVLRALAACVADWWLPRSMFAQTRRVSKPDRRDIVVTFGGGVRYEDTLGPEGWINIPHLASDLVPQGLVYPVARYDGITGHFNSTGAMITGCRQDVDSYGSEAPVTPTVFELFRKKHALPPEETWVVATNKSFGLMGGSKLKPFGDPYAADVLLPKQLLIETIKSAVSTDTGPGVGDRHALAEQLCYYIKSAAYRNRTLYLVLAEDAREMLAIRSDRAEAPLQPPAPASLADVRATMSQWLGVTPAAGSGRPIGFLTD